MGYILIFYSFLKFIIYFFIKRMVLFFWSMYLSVLNIYYILLNIYYLVIFKKFRVFCSILLRKMEGRKEICYFFGIMVVVLISIVWVLIIIGVISFVLYILLERVMVVLKK